ncbi:MAG: nuclease A inhibitor family protein [Nostoc sp. ChiSLP02]|nr:nuclease A inhibitor family protein [Nostoc sp. DedSLP05]MDZ8101713.1 nuclease A inhibitor family protein [Nostoc sp. DedSLP01]MDZ8185013.1 nuclease A inhibitor family protein [Nostoc sp. ChiSLP02]
MSSKITENLKQASDDLLMVSESDSPFQVFFWSGQGEESLANQKLLQLTSHSQDTPIETVDLDYFFRNYAEEKDWHDETQKQNVQKFRSLIQILKDNLIDIKVYRLGTVSIDVYIVGKTISGDLAGISTKVVET